MSTYTSKRNIGKVAFVDADAGTVVINKGTNAGLKIGDRLHIVRMGEEIIDPDSGESLGLLESLVGRVQVVHVQEMQSTAISIDRTKVPPPSNLASSHRPNSSNLISGSVNALLEAISFANSPRTTAALNAAERSSDVLPRVPLSATVGDIVVRI